MKFNEWIRTHWPAFIPVFLLCIVCFRQLYLVNTDYLTRWKGGGFGMFSEISYRFLHIHLLNRGAFECANHPQIYRNFTKRLIKHPNYVSLEKFTKQLSTHTWIYDQDYINGRLEKVVLILNKTDRLRKTDQICPFQELEVQVYDIKFSHKTAKASPVLLRKFKVVK